MEKNCIYAIESSWFKDQLKVYAMVHASCELFRVSRVLGWRRLARQLRAIYLM